MQRLDYADGNPVGDLPHRALEFVVTDGQAAQLDWPGVHPACGHATPLVIHDAPGIAVTGGRRGQGDVFPGQKEIARV